MKTSLISSTPELLKSAGQAGQFGVALVGEQLVFGGHAAHDVAPVTGEYVPCGQAVAEAEPGFATNVPTGAGMHTDEPAGA